jgi:hypothetical protein
MTVKFAAARTGSLDSLIRLLDACETFATAQGAGRVVAGVSTARRDAYRMLGERGYRADLIGSPCIARTSPAITARTPWSSTTGVDSSWHLPRERGRRPQRWGADCPRRPVVTGAASCICRPSLCCAPPTTCGAARR